MRQRHFDLPISYFDDGGQYDPLASLYNFQGPKLLVHAKNDEFVALERVKTVYERLNSPSMLVELDSTHDYRLYPKAIAKVEESLAEFLDAFPL